jgi:sulfopyruvate decarboxylase subunit alpha
MLSARAVRDQLEGQGVTDVVGLPDNSSSALFALLSRDERIRLRTVTREGEAFGLAAGLWVGGRRPLVLIQNTGLIESGDALRGTVMRMRVPLVCLVTYRGHARMERGLGGVPASWDEETLSRADVDSVAVVTEPTLRAWGVPFEALRADEDLPRLAAAFETSGSRRCPVALLVTGDMS